MIQKEKLIGIFGFVIMLFLAWCLSENRRKMDWRVIITGVLLQILIAFFLLKTEIGKRIFSSIGHVFTKIIEFSNEGASFLFGPDLVHNTVGFNILPTIIFVSTLSALLFYSGILQKIVAVMAWVMVRVMNISGAESLAASANIYVGMTESPLLIRPYLSTATRSELMAIMTGGMATIAGGVMAAYVHMGASAGHLLTGSLMSAPAALVIAKIMVPETEDSPTRGVIRIHPEKNGANFVDAACRGATEGLMLALNVGVVLIAAISLIAMLNWILGVIPDIFGAPLTLQRILGWFFAPFSLLMGVSYDNIFQVGQLLGEKTVLNEFLAYSDLIKLQEGGELSERSFVIAQYALCGFANLGSIAIMVGGISQLVPERRTEMAQLGFRSLIAGTLACFCTACIAGLLL